MPREIITEWTTPSGSDHRTIMWFDNLGSVADQRADLNTFWTGVKAALDTDVTYLIANEGREVNDASGTLTALWTHATTYTGTGTVSGQVVADATQILVKWHTPTIINGRFLQGRSFIPGMTTGNLVNGAMGVGSAAGVKALGETLVANPNSLGVWHRPVAGSGGQWVQAVACSVWTELAVLRRRR